jgi:hypothetical protein
MPEPRAQRTLVKSPPELWAEITDVSSLARHLGGFGEIRITRVEAETTVAWEGDRARGTVELAPAGWGTKVTLTAEAVAGAAAPRAAADVADSAPAVEMATDEAAPETTDAAQTAAEAAPSADGSAEATEAQPTAAAAPAPELPVKIGFLARLLRRLRGEAPTATEAAPAPEDAAEATDPTEPLTAPEPAGEIKVARVATAEKASPASEATPTPEDAPTTQSDAGSEPGPDRALSDEEIESILVGALDSLGSAHHRPFSRT